VSGGGNGTVDDCETNNLTLSSSCVIYSDGGRNVTVTSSFFSKISRTVGNGSVFSGNIWSGCEVVLMECEITECKSSSVAEENVNAGGGGMSLNIGGAGLFEMTSTRIRECETNIVSGRGGSVLITLVDGSHKLF